MPLIQAEDELLAMESHWLALPAQSEDELRHKQRRLRSAMQVIMQDEPNGGRPKLSQEQHAVYLAALGIGYEIVEGEITSG